MRYILLIGMLMGLAACDMTATSEYVNPNDIKQADEMCKSNGGLNGVLVTVRSRNDGTQYVKVQCNNGVSAYQVRGK